MPKSRDLNFEFLRLTSMLAIVYGHLSQAGPEIVNPLTMFGDVNCFILITGYFMTDGKFKFSRVVRLVIETVFYCFIISLIFYVINPNKIGIFQLIKSIFPFAPTAFSYWFVNKYLGLILLQPFLSFLIQKISRKQFEYLLFILLILNSQFLNFFPFSVLFDNGWSLPWFITVFLIGAYVKMYKPFEIINNLFIWSCIWFISIVSFNLVSIFHLEFLIDLQYNNWIFILKSFATFMMFRKLKIDYNSFIGKCIAFCAPNIFAIYIIHNQYFLISWLPSIGLKFTFSDNIWVFLILYCIFIIGVMLGCILIDKVRLYIFKIVGLTNCLNNFSNKIDHKLKTITNLT